MSKLTDMNTYEEVMSLCKSKGYTQGIINQKIKWFTDNNRDGRYDNILWCLVQVNSVLPSKQKIDPELAKEYLDSYGGTKAIIKLKEDFDIVITRQGLYKAAEKCND